MVPGARLAVTGERPRLVEWVTAGYGLVVAAVALSRLWLGPARLGMIALAHLLLVVLMVLVTRPGVGRAGRVLRELAPLLVLPALYSALDVLSGGGRVASHDAVILAWEQRLFGMQPARDWWQRQPSTTWSTLLHGVYWGYYFLLAIPALVLARDPDRRRIARFARYVVPTYLLCYLVFVFLPVGGPYYVFPRPAAWFLDNAPARLVYRTLDGGSSYGAAFPSSHVAATLAAFVATWLDARRLAWVTLVPVILMPIATVYCQMHYALDAIVGVVVGLAVPALAERLETAPAAA
ncbi:MAG: phosphatase PAP2 family protein [Gemmatimonadales bacterium]|jgi:membrane-associated phospholipid phosphatase|nr:phosphatase PAP2 family protein [Gemmatimonadales bacterium]